MQISEKSGFDQAEVNKIKNAFSSNLSKGHKPLKVSTFLIEKGYKTELIDFAFEEFLTEGADKILPFIKIQVEQGHSVAELEKIFKEKGVPDCVISRALQSA